MALAEPLSPIEGHIEHRAEKKKRAIIIDTDTGIDDAQALVMALRSDEVSVLAIIASHGNVSLAYVEGNVCACLHACGRTDVPVYIGAACPLVHVADEDASEWHGKDGLGNTQLGVTAPRECIVSGVSGANAIFHIASKYHEEHGELVSVITIGPLSTLSLSVRCHPRLPSLIGTVFIMGGAERGHGNVGFPSLSAEYNFFADPEAAAVVMSTFPRITLSSWELTLKYGIKQPLLGAYLTRSTSVGTFLNDVSEHLVSASGEEYIEKRGLSIPDPIAMCIALRPQVITNSAKHAVFVETRGIYTRGATIVDWRDVSGKSRNVEVVDAIDEAQLHEMLLHSVRA